MRQTIARHSPLIMLAVLMGSAALYSPTFGSPGNLKDTASRTSEIGIIAMGELVVIITGGIDLSVGSVAALSGVTSSLAMKEWGVPVPLGVVIALLTGLACGWTNGMLVTKGRIPAFIVTLGMMMCARGAAMLLSGAKPVFGLPRSFEWLGGTRGWYVPVAIMVTIVVIFAVTLLMTRFGRALYATGGNLNAARLSGLNVDRVRIAAFSLSGMLAGLAGTMLASRTSVASPNAADMWELDAIAACVIGGASLMGGEGGAVAALAGALIMVVLDNFCNLQDINPHWQQLFVGALIVALVFYDNYRKRKTGLIKG